MLAYVLVIEYTFHSVITIGTGLPWSVAFRIARHIFKKIIR